MTLHTTPQQHSMSAISQLLLYWFWWNFKGKCLGISGTDHNCPGDNCPGNISPGYICQYQEHHNCYGHDFDQTLKVGSWEHLEPIPTVTWTFVQATFVLQNLSISGISQLLVTRFWPNFKGRFLGPSLTDVNCHGIICLGNICPGHICSYQHNLSCYWPHFDQNFGT